MPQKYPKGAQGMPQMLKVADSSIMCMFNEVWWLWSILIEALSKQTALLNSYHNTHGILMDNLELFSSENMITNFKFVIQ